MLDHSEKVTSFLTGKVFPNLSKEKVSVVFSHLTPILHSEDRLTLMCPKCGGNAEYYVGTGSVYCPECKSINLVEALSYLNDDSIKNNVKLLSTAAAVQMPLSVYKDLLAPKTKLSEIIRDLTQMDYASNKLLELGLNDEQVSACKNLVYIKDSEQLVQAAKAVIGWFPDKLADDLRKFSGNHALLLTNNFKLTVVKLNGYSSSPFPFIRNFTQGSNTSVDVYITDDPLFAELSWSMGLNAYLLNERNLTENSIAYLRKHLGNRNAIAVWNKVPEVPTRLDFIKKSYSYDWFGNKVPGCYQRIMEVFK